MRSYFIPLAAVFLSILNFSPAHAQAHPELYDYLTQDVCLNSSGAVVAGDPATCPNRRNIGLYENSPYIVTDFDSVTGATYSATNSFPVLGTDGYTRIMVSKNLQGGFNSNFQFSFSEARDGYDLIDVTFTTSASFIRTSDGGCYDQIWSRSASYSTPGARAGGWRLFPLPSAPSSWPQTNSATHATYHIQLTPNRPGCVSGSSIGRTYWNAPAQYQFETGKLLTAIRSDHFAAENLSQQNNALERYYFTKEYGYTRWEAWIPRSRCYQERGTTAPICHPESTNYPLQSRCKVMNVSSTGHPGLDRWGNQDWVRVDCRDQTNYVALNTPQIMLDTVMAQTNGVVDINFHQLNESLATYAAPGTTLLSNQTIMSPDGRFTFRAQSDFNVVQYMNATPLWASNTAGASVMGRLAFQTDGNLVLYNNVNVPYWSSASPGFPNAALYVKNDGNVVILSNRARGALLWNTNTCCH
ncbi:hypothetical protein PX699_24370 [Sphingobium sp. H39-3-25]|uniref:hypothetical protein n=1 Tax=Sphingomonadales TaxID=204457 RepID=UPI001456C228|nr:hypothetical protein [Sphingomonas sp. S2M10]MDF0545500.1 hypothetical protein [Sphingobium arseniciresistens]NLS25069.1 hypothetical protein [Sphingomonas sp. S2M10]